VGRDDAGVWRDAVGWEYGGDGSRDEGRLVGGDEGGRGGGEVAGGGEEGSGGCDSGREIKGVDGVRRVRVDLSVVERGGGRGKVRGQDPFRCGVGCFAGSRGRGRGCMF